MIDTVTVSLDITIGDFRLNCSRTIDGIAWRDKPLAMLEQELSQVLIQILQPAVAAWDARRAAMPS
jgi:hypothetical protein